jgi:uncharacterized membrane protein YfcA
MDILPGPWGWPTLAAVLAIGALGGFVRGVTGFGAAMVMGPPVALLISPAVAVPLVLLLEGFAAAPMLRQAARRAHWSVLTPMLVAAALFVPLGAWALSSLDPLWARRAIATVVLVFSLVLLAGLRWRGRYRRRIGAGLGALSGTLIGSTGIGGPPVILYLLSGPDDAATVRANLTLFIAGSSAIGVMVLALAGVVNRESLLLGACMTPLFVGGVLLGSRVFMHLSEQRFRRGVILMMLSVAAYVLLS